MVKVRVSTDSTADVPQNFLEELDIPVLPLTVLAEGKEYRDGVDITPQEFYKLLDACTELPVSAQVSVNLYTQLFEDTLKAGFTHLIHVSINAKGSGTYQAGEMAKELFYEEHPEAKDKLNIRIIDSRTYSMGYGLAVIEGARLAKEGGSPEEVTARIQDFLDHSRILVVPLNLRFCKQSGRVSAAAAFLGDAIGLKPMVTFEKGESKILAKPRGLSKAVEAMIETCRKERRPGTSYALAYTENPEAFQALKSACLPALGEEPTAQFPLGCIISLNIGPDSIGLIYRT